MWLVTRLVVQATKAASAAENPALMEITVERIAEGEVWPFLTEELLVGDTLEIRGPIGGYFTWRPTSEMPLMLIAGGSGVVPLMSMLRSRGHSTKRVSAALLYSVRKRESIIQQPELERLAAEESGRMRRRRLGSLGVRERVDRTRRFFGAANGDPALAADGSVGRNWRRQ
jgi:ferredoxin-NADP reductase